MSIFLKNSLHINWCNFVKSNLFYGKTRHISQVLAYGCTRCYCDKAIESAGSKTGNDVPHIDDIADYLQIEKKILNEALQKEPKLRNVHPMFWKNSLQALRTSGFSGKECIHVITAVPSILKAKPDLILIGMKNWQCTALGDYKLLSLLTSCPQLLFVDGHEISKRYPVLKTLSSRKNIAELLRRYPDFMLVDWNDFLAKLKYVEEDMKINRNEICKCDILRCSLFELMARHRFLELLGKYVEPNTKTEEHVPNKNPTLKQIVDSDDFSFATNLGGVTLEEFEVFKELYRTEINEGGADSEYV